MTPLRTVLTVFGKELRDALRDRRTLITVLVSSVLMGPLVLLAISGLVASLEASAEQREVVVAGLENAPSLKNFFERQTFVVKPAPADYEARLIQPGRRRRQERQQCAVEPSFKLLRGCQTF